MVYYSATKRSKIQSLGELLMDLESVTQGEASQKEKSKSEREKQILYINRYMWSLENWYWWPISRVRKEIQM